MQKDELTAILKKHALTFPNFQMSEAITCAWAEHFIEAAREDFDKAVSRAVREAEAGFFPSVGKVWVLYTQIIDESEKLPPEKAFDLALEVARFVRRDGERKREAKTKFSLEKYPALRKCLNDEWLYRQLLVATRPYTAKGDSMTEYELVELKRAFIKTYLDYADRHKWELEAKLVDAPKREPISYQAKAIMGKLNLLPR